MTVLALGGAPKQDTGGGFGMVLYAGSIRADFPTPILQVIRKLLLLRGTIVNRTK